ncbi:MAG: hypothetical protein WED27_09330, partial [Pirellulales bacterium]
SPPAKHLVRRRSGVYHRPYRWQKSSELPALRGSWSACLVFAACLVFLGVWPLFSLVSVLAITLVLFFVVAVSARALLGR